MFQGLSYVVTSFELIVYNDGERQPWKKSGNRLSDEMKKSVAKADRGSDAYLTNICEKIKGSNLPLKK